MKTKALPATAICLTLVTLSMITWAVAADSGYHVVKTYTLGGEGGYMDGNRCDPASNRVFAFKGRSHGASVSDARKGAVINTIKLDGKPELGVTDEKGEVFVSIEDKSEVTAIESKGLQVKSNW